MWFGEADGVTCLMVARKNLSGGAEIMKLLGVQRREIFDLEDFNSESVLHYDCSFGNVSIVKAVIAVEPKLTIGFDHVWLRPNPNDPLATMQEIK